MGTTNMDWGALLSGLGAAGQTLGPLGVPQPQQPLHVQLTGGWTQTPNPLDPVPEPIPDTRSKMQKAIDDEVERMKNG